MACSTHCSTQYMNACATRSCISVFSCTARLSAHVEPELSTVESQQVSPSMSSTTHWLQSPGIWRVRGHGAPLRKESMGRPRCQRCRARPGRRIMCVWGCGRLLGLGCKQKCLLAEFIKGYGACQECLPPLPLESGGAGNVRPTARVTGASSLQQYPCTCLPQPACATDNMRCIAMRTPPSPWLILM